MKEKLKSAIWGAIVGDCLGVPVEFYQRQELKENPVVTMLKHGTYNKPLGTWSDDSAFTLATLDGLSPELNIETIARNFVDCYKHNKYWQRHLFDIGGTTSTAIERINTSFTRNAFSPHVEYGCDDVSQNGNGSLMRMIAVVMYLYLNKNKHHTTIDTISDEFQDRRKITYQLSSLTHAHPYSRISCHIYVEYCLLLLNGVDKLTAYKEICKTFSEYIGVDNFSLLLDGKLHKRQERHIKSDGYVINTLTASIWCILKNKTYKDSVFCAVNLGDDTDTTACVTGGMAGIIYGYNSIPTEYIDNIYQKQKADIVIENFMKRNMECN